MTRLESITNYYAIYLEIKRRGTLYVRGHILIKTTCVCVKETIIMIIALFSAVDDTLKSRNRNDLMSINNLMHAMHAK